MFFIVTGKLGGGKSLVAVSRIRDYLIRGCRVATNLNLNLEYLLPITTQKVDCIRIPDLPTINDLKALGPGYEGEYDESKFGALVIDEGSGNFNSREWANKDRQLMIDWLKHSRKHGWDVYIIVQDVGMLDKQIRDAFGEHLVICRRLDRLSIPFLTAITRFMGKAIRPPKVHVGIVRYGIKSTDAIVDRWVYRAKGLHKAYDTRQVFIRDNEYIGNSVYLSPYLFKGRNMTKFQLAKLMSSSFVGSAFLAGAFMAWGGAWWLYKGSQNPLLQKGMANLEAGQKPSPSGSTTDPVTAVGWSYGDTSKYLYMSDGSKKQVRDIARTQAGGVSVQDNEGIWHAINQ